MGNLQKNFSHTFKGKVWNIESEINGDYLILEVRDEEKFETLFYIYQPSKKALLDNPIILEESWWVGLTHAAGHIILFHIFKDTENPQEKEYLAWNIRSGTVVWKKSDISFTEFGSESLRGIQNGYVITLDIVTGELIANSHLVGTVENNDVVFPFHYVPKSEYHVTVCTFLERIGMNSDKQYGIDYLETKGLILLAFYTKGKGLENKLIVLDKDGEVYLNEVLGVELKGIADRPFFVYGDSLIFVKGNSDFLSYQLSRQ